LREAPGNVVVVVWMGVGLLRHDENLRAQRAQKVYLFSRLGFWTDDQCTVAAGGAHDRQADAGVPTCPLDDGAAGFQQPSRLGVLDNTQGHAILDRSAGVDELRLAEDIA